MCSGKKQSWVIPFGGNGFVTNTDSGVLDNLITPCGVADWTSSSTIISLYFHTQYPGKVLAGLRLKVADGSSVINVTVTHNDLNIEGKNQSEVNEISIQGNDFQMVNLGTFNISSAGYVRMDIRGIEKSGSSFATISDAFLISESHSLLEPMHLRFVDDPADFYFGRRGPSVHLQFPLPEESDTEYFYNEIIVPKNQDVIGSYYCAMGFSGYKILRGSEPFLDRGYFGMQVNSSSERRVLFSIWSEYDSDDPEEIPEDYKVKLLRRGEDVYVGEFGNEGSGAQSYLQYKWETDKPYKFLIQAVPTGGDRTMYTAWFNFGQGWILIASFDKPKVSTFVKGTYSFSENFIPEMGFIERHCIFANQWARSVNGNWMEITKAKFTADDTSAKEARMDICGGVGIDGNESNFFLKNCGFFSRRVDPGTEFIRKSNGSQPPVDVSLLP